jgi:hypothetical protein
VSALYQAPIAGMFWVHRGKFPRYMAPAGPDAKPVAAHDVDATYNAQGDWVCKRCGELIQLEFPK